MHRAAYYVSNTTLLDCIQYLTLYLYDPGTLIGSANQCILGIVYLGSNLTREHAKMSNLYLSQSTSPLPLRSETAASHMMKGEVCQSHPVSLQQILASAQRFTALCFYGLGLEAACEHYFRRQSTRVSFPMLSVAKLADHLGLTSLCKFAAEAIVQHP